MLETLVGHSGLVTCVEFIDDAHLASADDTGLVRIWKLNSDGKAWSLLMYILSNILKYYDLFHALRPRSVSI